jgi:hypothetical protein
MKKHFIGILIAFFVCSTFCVAESENASSNDIQKLIAEYDRQLNKIEAINTSDKNPLAKEKLLESANQTLETCRTEILKMGKEKIKSVILEYIKDEQERMEKVRSIYLSKDTYPPQIGNTIKSIKNQQSLIKALLAIYFHDLKEDANVFLADTLKYPATFDSYAFNYNFEQLPSVSEMYKLKREARSKGEILELPKIETSDPFKSVDLKFSDMTVRYCPDENGNWEARSIRSNLYNPKLFKTLFGAEFIVLVKEIGLDSRFKSILFYKELDKVYIDDVKVFNGADDLGNRHSGNASRSTCLVKASDGHWSIKDTTEWGKQITSVEGFEDLGHEFTSSEDNQTASSNKKRGGSSDNQQELADKVVAFIVDRSSTFRNATFKGTENRASEVSYNYDVEYVVGNGSLKVGTFNVAIQNGKCREVYFNGKELWVQVIDPKLSGYRNPPN